MPTYTYRCQKCGEEFERFQSMSDPPVKRCPECKGKVQRVFHPVGIVLKGSGFHRNDYRSPAAKKSGDSGSSDSSGSEKSDSGSEKSDSSSSSKSEKTESKTSTKNSGGSKKSGD